MAMTVLGCVLVSLSRYFALVAQTNVADMEKGFELTTAAANREFSNPKRCVDFTLI